MAIQSNLWGRRLFLSLEQGCGRKGQGHLEHLWALMELIEDSCEGRDGQVQKDVYALFADVSKAYDQVWRSGLYSL